MLEINALTPVTHPTVQQFHEKRLLFVIYNNKVYCEDKPSGLSHIDWFKTLDINEDPNVMLNECVRGYYFGNLMFYKGINFNCDNSVITSVKHHLKEITEKMGVSGIAHIGLGAVPNGNNIFKAKHMIGKVNDIIH